MHIDEHGRKIYVGQEAIDTFLRGVKRLRENRKLHYKTEFQGLPISVENRKGSVRSGTDPNGKEWRTKHKHPYGYIPGTEGPDGDGVDVFVGPNEDAAYAYVVHIKNPETGEYDEDKVFLGFDSKEKALDSFRAHYDEPNKFFDSVDQIPMWKFRDKVFVKKHTTKKLVASRGGNPSVLPYDRGQQIVAPISMVARFYPDVLGSLETHEHIEAFPDIESPDTIPTLLKKKRTSEAGADLGGEDEHSEMFGKKGPYGDSLGTDQKMKRSILGHHQDIMTDPEVREGGPGSGPQEKIERAGGEYRGAMDHPKGGKLHMFNDPETGSTLAIHDDDLHSVKDVRDKILKSRKDFFQGEASGFLQKELSKRGMKDEDVPDVTSYKKESQEYGVKGMKWGVRHARKDSASSKHPVTGKAQHSSKRPVVAPNRTLNQMTGDVAKGNAIAAKATAQNQQQAQQGKPVNPSNAHNEVLKEMVSQLGWKIAGAVARVAGVGGLFDSIRSIIESPSGKKFALKTDKQGNHSVTPAGKTEQPAEKKAKPSAGKGYHYTPRKRVKDNESVRESRRDFEERLGSFLRESKRKTKKKIYYARSLQRYGSGREAEDLDFLSEAYPGFGINSPKTRRHAELGMGYFHKKVDKAKEVVITGLHRRKITAGVASEARHALKKGIPVRFLRHGKLRTVEAIENIEGGRPGGHYARVIFKKRRKKK